MKIYIDPPKGSQDPEEWRKWLKKNDAKARAAKAAETKCLRFEPRPERYLDAQVMVKRNGTWCQSPATALSGDFESGQGEFDIMVYGGQEAYVQARQDRKRKIRRGKSAARHRKRKSR